MALVLRRSRVVLAALVVVALAAAALVVGAAKSSHALNGKILVLSTVYSAASDFNEGVAAQSLGLGTDVVTPEQWAAMTSDQFAQYDAIVLGDNSCGDDPEGPDSSDSSVLLAAPLANLATWIPAVRGNVFFSTSDAVYHANSGDNETGAQLQVTKGVAYAAGAGTTGLYFTSSCYDDDAWLGVLNAVSPGWTADDGESDNIHVTGSAALLMGLDDAALVNYDSTVHHFVDSWPSDFTVYAIARTLLGTDAVGNGHGGAAAAAAVDGPYQAQDGTTGAPVILVRGANTSPSHILLQDDQTHPTGEAAHLLATVTNPNLEQQPEAAALPVDGITVTFTAVSGPNAGKVLSGVTDADGNVTVDYTSTTVGADVWHATFVDPDEHTETSNQVTVTWTAPAPAADVVVVTPRFTG